MENNSQRSYSPRNKRKIGTMFSGSISELIEHEAIEAQRPLVDIHACISTVSMNVLLFADTVIIFHSPTGCLDEAFGPAYANARLRGAEVRNPSMFDLRNIHCVSTGFNEKDVIYGGEENLKRAILEAKKRYNPKMICVLASCISAIIGDDVVSVCNEMQDEVGEDTYLLAFDNQGFQSNTWMHYADNIWPVLVNKVMKEQEEIDPDLVNFFRPINMTAEDLNEIERLLDGIGFRANFFPDYQSIEFIESAPEASLNIGLCRGYHEPVFKAMEHRFNTPYADGPYPLGIEFTSIWLREIAKKSNRIEATEEFIAEEIERITPELNELREKLDGKTVIVTANHAKTTALVQACNELNMKVLSMVTHATDETLHPEYELIKKHAGDIDVHVGSPAYEEISHFFKHKPDVILGHWEISSIASQLGFATKNSYYYYFQKAHVGFEGLLVLGRQMIKVLDNPIRSKILKYHKNKTGLNWKESPFNNSNDPFKFAKGCCGGKKEGERHCAHRKVL